MNLLISCSVGKHLFYVLSTFHKAEVHQGLVPDKDFFFHHNTSPAFSGDPPHYQDPLLGHPAEKDIDVAQRAYDFMIFIRDRPEREFLASGGGYGARFWLNQSKGKKSYNIEIG